MSAAGVTAMDVRDRNRRVMYILLAVMAVLIVASFLVGIRW